MGGHFKTLLDWRFDPERSLKEKNFRKNENWRKIFDREFFNYELFGDKSEILDFMVPPRTSSSSREIYSILTQHVNLVRGEMGVSFRESRSGISTILKQYGYDYVTFKPIIDDYEYRLMNQFNEETTKK